MSKNPIRICPNEYAFDFAQSGKISGVSHPTGSPSSDLILFGEGFVNDLSIAKGLSQALDPLFADLVDVALFVYLADRLSPRRKPANPRSHFQWGRKISLKIPVRSPEIWSNPEINSSLKQLLRFFTEDDWRIDFESRQKFGRASESQVPLFQFPLPKHLRIALYSGGLDSFAGIIQQIAELPDHNFVLVSGVTHTRQGNGQREQVRIIKGIAPDRITHIPIFYGLRHGGERVEEVSQRSRGFLFMALGAATAITAGARELYVYENGIGAINLPYDGTQIGTANTRAVNPISVLRMSKFISDLTGSDFRIHNPFLFRTKGEMCSHPAVHRLGEHIGLTFSCDSYPIRKKGQSQCGVCTSCLLRRQAIESAGLSIYDPTSDYLGSWKSPYIDRVKLRPLMAMEWQAQKIATCLANEDSWQRLICEFPLLMEIASEISLANGSESTPVKDSLVRLYSQYVSEWMNFSAHNYISSQVLAA